MRDVDQRGFDNQPKELLTAAQATALLDIKRPTLYAYVSRGLIRSVPGPGSRARRYLRQDVERLRARHDARAGHGAVAAGALRWGEAVLSTTISTVTPRGPRYAGFDAVDLVARDVSFERAAELLFTRALPEGPVRWPAATPGLPAALRSALIPEGSAPVPAMLGMVAALQLREPEPRDPAPETELPRARILVRRLVGALALARRPQQLTRVLQAPTIAQALALAFGVAPGPAALALLDRVLVLSADHELNSSTFTARVAASAGANLHACFAAALGTYSGPRHGGAVDRIDALVEEVGRPARAARVLAERVRRSEAIDGFGHLLYAEAGDPRAPPLLEAAHRLAPRQLAVRTVRAIVDEMEKRGLRPSVDLGVVAAGRALGLAPGESIALFAIGRCAGWIAHVMEQRTQQFLVRPRARYLGN
jgi:citrate synthase